MDMNSENKFDFVLSNISFEPNRSVNEALSSLNNIEENVKTVFKVSTILGQFFKNRDEIQKLGLQALIVLPIVANRKRIAFLSVFLDKIHYFSEHELELLSTLANQAIIAIENAKLYSKIEQTNNYLESIIRSSADLIISTDIEYEVLAKNNRMIIISWSFSSLINQNNEIIGTLGIGKGISKQKYLKKKDIH